MPELPRIVLAPDARQAVDRLLTGGVLVLSLHGIAFAAGRVWDATKPFGNAVEQWDDDTRVYTDFTSGVAVTRPYTADEAAEADQRATTTTVATNTSTLLAKSRQALTVNATYLALSSPTAAQTTAQVKALTRQISALIKLRIGDLTDTTGT